MVATQSSMIEIGTKASDFHLEDHQKNIFSLNNFENKPLFMMFICNHCPYVIHVIKKLVELTEFAQENGIACLAINSNDVENYPEDSPEKMISFAKKNNFNFPYLFDEKQEVAKAYKAACTPDFFLYNKDKRLFYRGQMDSSRPGNNKIVTGESLLRAIKDLLTGKTSPLDQKPSIGCNIKWKA